MKATISFTPAEMQELHLLCRASKLNYGELMATLSTKNTYELDIETKVFWIPYQRGLAKTAVDLKAFREFRRSSDGGAELGTSVQPSEKR